MQRRAAHFSRIFVDYELPTRAEALERVVGDWRPDLVVHEVAELAAPLVATAHDIPYATHSFGAVIDTEIVSAAADAAAPYWREAGLRPHPRAGLWQHLYVDNWPAALHHGAGPVGDPPRQPVRPLARRGDSSPDDRHVIYVTLGTVFNDNHDLFRAVVDAVSDLGYRVLVTVGENGDPQRLGTVSHSVQVERFVPQEQILPQCRLVIAHGGAGTTLGALAYACPLLLVPQAADQHVNADRVARAGAGLSVPDDERTAAGIRHLATTILADPSYARAAESIAAEIAAMPGPAEVAAALERLAAS